MASKKTLLWTDSWLRSVREEGEVGLIIRNLSDSYADWAVADSDAIGRVSGMNRKEKDAFLNFPRRGRFKIDDFGAKGFLMSIPKGLLPVGSVCSFISDRAGCSSDTRYLS